MSSLEERAAAIAAALLGEDPELAGDVSIAAARYALWAHTPIRLSAAVFAPPPARSSQVVGERTDRLEVLLDALWPAARPLTDENLPEEVSPVRPGERTREAGR